jgi:ATP-dependent helicase/nuclease subunit A
VEEHASAVRLLTIHQAKGLEFPVVILADAAYGQRRVNRPGIIERIGGKLELRLGPRDLTWGTLGWQDAEAREQEHEAAEERRLWYVAATRVRDHLVIPVVFPSDGKTKSVEHWAMSPELLLRIAKEIEGENTSDGEKLGVWIYRPRPGVSALPTTTPPLFPVFSQVKHDESAVQAYTMWDSTRRRVLASGKQTASLATVTALAATQSSLFPEKAPLATSEGESLARLRFGRAVHAALRHVSSSDKLNMVAGRFSGVWGPGEKEELEQLVANALASPVMSRARKAEERFAETPIALHLNGRLIEGIIDLAFIEDGTWVVVDFKTDNVTRAAVTMRADAYRMQLYLYALALERVTQRPVRELVLLFVRSSQEVTFSWGETERRLAETCAAIIPEEHEGSE